MVVVKVVVAVVDWNKMLGVINNTMKIGETLPERRVSLKYKHGNVKVKVCEF